MKVAVLHIFIAAASAACVLAPIESHEVPTLPHGLDWNLPEFPTLLLPNLEIPISLLSEAEIRLILPSVMKLGYSDALLTIGPADPGSRRASVGPLVAILAGLSLLLIAYELTPRTHSRFLRFRSVNLRRDLFT